MFNANALQKLKNINTNPGASATNFERFGKVVEVIGTVIEASLHQVPIGALVKIFDEHGSFSVEGEVVGFKKDRALIFPFSDPVGVCAGAFVQCLEREQRIRVGDHLIGRILDGYLRPMDGKPITESEGEMWPIAREPLNPLSRRRIRKPLDLGVRALNSLLTCGEGQRIGIMAGSGVGKSVLLGMIARYTQADINVIALIGERGREVREFLEDNLGPEGLKRSIVIVATGDHSQLIRVRAAHVATAIAEYFREAGKKVLLMMDSLTRVAMAAREIGLAVGEPPTTKGYTPSVFSLLPRLLERAGNSDSAGSVTGIYTVLVDGDDFNDPICDAARSILDGHINLSRQLAERNHFPAIDVLASASRVMQDVVSEDQLRNAGVVRDLMATYARNEDVIQLGVYNQGSNAKIDRAMAMQTKIEKFLVQDRNERADFDKSLAELQLLTDQSVSTH